jgi:hypothetical protein
LEARFSAQKKGVKQGIGIELYFDGREEKEKERKEERKWQFTGRAAAFARLLV